jgi:flagellar motor switch protein FliN
MGQDHPHHWFGERMSSVKDVKVEISVLLGRSKIPMHQLLRMGRGAVIELDSHQDEPVTILANNMPVAKGEILIEGDRIAVSISEILKANS